MQGLRRLVVSRTNITSIPAELCDLEALLEMNLGRNVSMEGSLAQNFSKLKFASSFVFVQDVDGRHANMDGGMEFLQGFGSDKCCTCAHNRARNQNVVMKLQQNVRDIILSKVIFIVEAFS